MITVYRIIKRGRIRCADGDIKTIGRRVAQCYRARYGREPREIQEGRYTVKAYPKEFTNDVVRIANKYFKQRGKVFSIGKRKRTLNNYVGNE